MMYLMKERNGKNWKGRSHSSGVGDGGIDKEDDAAKQGFALHQWPIQCVCVCVCVLYIVTVLCVWL